MAAQRFQHSHPGEQGRAASWMPLINAVMPRSRALTMSVMTLTAVAFQDLEL
ncbi:hypothetical protein [Arthrobacter sp. Y81]|uniref:hypothetical protein n=1 Tax=Arthrobacter sp. Y81 TaxID=2058897 RepID=UPI0021570362|nr:hypothetical protein [Arthrobacter sp. Y81]